MPYITKDELRLILSDLPEYQVLGRSRKPATEPTTARVAYAHVDLDHLRDNILRADRDKINKNTKICKTCIIRTKLERWLHPIVSMGWT